MTFVKRAVLLFIFIFLVSCSDKKPDADYFDLPRLLYVTFEDESGEIDGTLEVEEGCLRFSPSSPEGVVIELTDEGGRISLGELVFESGVTELSRLTPLFEGLKSKSLKMTFGEKSHPLTVSSDGYKLTIHKEITK